MLDPEESPEEIKSREVELGSERWTNLCFSCSIHNSCATDIVFVTLLRTAVKAAISGVHQFIASHWRGPHCLNVVVLAVVHGPLGFFEGRSARTSHSLFPPPPPFPVPNKPSRFCGRKATCLLLLILITNTVPSHVRCSPYGRTFRRMAIVR